MLDDREQIAENYKMIVDDAIDYVLTDREAEIIRCQLLTEKKITMAKLATRFGISTERVRQIRNEAMVKLSAHLIGEMNEMEQATLFDYSLPEYRLY